MSLIIATKQPAINEIKDIKDEKVRKIVKKYVQEQHQLLQVADKLWKKIQKMNKIEAEYWRVNNEIDELDLKIREAIHNVKD